ncbi:MAG: hypothetical protein WKG32_08390 [Gemmatimonadaceae bacterium]
MAPIGLIEDARREVAALLATEGLDDEDRRRAEALAAARLSLDPRSGEVRVNAGSGGFWRGTDGLRLLAAELAARVRRERYRMGYRV